jgi:hypothetical protein
MYEYYWIELALAAIVAVQYVCYCTKKYIKKS